MDEGVGMDEGPGVPPPDDAAAYYDEIASAEMGDREWLRLICGVLCRIPVGHHDPRVDFAIRDFHVALAERGARILRSDLEPVAWDHEGESDGEADAGAG